MFFYVLNPHSDIIYEARVEDGAHERFAALNWTEVDKPAEGEYIPNMPEVTTWVRLFYLALNVHHDYPNRAEVLAGALEAGWVYP